jgi:cysteine desulfurase / selenocysteine lyase
MIFPDGTLARARSLFPYLAQGSIYLNHAGTSPLSARVVETMHDYFRRRSEGEIETYPRDMAMVKDLRAGVAQLVHAESPERIAFQPNTSDAINVVASGIPWHSGDRILLNGLEFPANVYPFLNLRPLGVEVDFVKPDGGRVTSAMLAAAITPRTRMVALSAVQFLSGYRADLRAIGTLCREKGIIFAVDGIQAVGAVRLDVQEMKIDALAAGAQKWQMGPHGTGFLYLTDELQARIRQKSLGWLSLDDPWKFYDYEQPLASSARRYEGGSLNMPGLWGMHAAITTLLEFGPAQIESHLLSITAELMDGFRALAGVRLFTPPGESERAGIVTISLPPSADPEKVFRAMRERSVTAAVRDGMLRYSPHFCNSPDDMRRTAAVTGESLR